jgi:pantothenate synthetase
MVTPGANFSELAEGKARGSHFFVGVATIVTKVCILWCFSF